MRKYIILLFVSTALFFSCSFEDVEVSHTTIVLFWNQEYNRNIVVGEGLMFRPGIILGGVLDNKKDRVVKYVVDPSIVTDPSKTVLPPSYYTLGHASEIVIKKGEHIGFLDVVMDSVAFLNDPKSLTGEYVLPIRVTDSFDVDSINANKDHIMTYISYWAKQHGNYYYTGQAVKKSGGTVVETLEYSDFRNIANSIRSFTTVGPNTLRLGADMSPASQDPAKNKYSFYVTLASLGSGNVTISSDPAYSIEVQPNGASTYDATTKIFTLNYKYMDGEHEVEVSETMEFRNRIRDINNGQGLNEWRDIP